MSAGRDEEVAAAAVPRAVWLLGLVSLLMDTSSELIHSLLPVFLVTTLGASVASLGLIEGVAEATAAILKVVSGAWSDRLGRRKGLVVAGYGLAALAKPLFPLAASVGAVLAARVIDRIGKGVRGAPRDALIAEVTPPARRGAAFGLRQALDTVGAVLGPLLGMALMVWLSGNVRAVFWAAALPALLAVAVLVLGLREPAPSTETRMAAAVRKAARPRDLARLGAPLWGLLGVALLIGLARYSEAFLLLDAQRLGLEMSFVPVVLLVINVVYAATAYPSGALSDRLGRMRLLVLGLLVLIAAHLLLAFAETVALVLAGAALWGLHMGLSQGLLSALVADAAPSARRGTGFGAFHFVTGIALLAGNLAAGLVWERGGAAAAFGLGAALAALALLGMLLWQRIFAGQRGK